MYRRGLSDVVTTVLIILLVVVSVVAIGAYVVNLVGSSGRTVEREGVCLASTVTVDGCRWFKSTSTVPGQTNRTVVSIDSSTDSTVTAVTQLSYVFMYADGSSETFTSVNSLPGVGKASVSQEFANMSKQPSSVAVGGRYTIAGGKTVSCPVFTPASCITEATSNPSFLAFSPSALNVRNSIGGAPAGGGTAGAGSTGSSSGTGSSGTGSSGSTGGTTPPIVAGALYTFDTSGNPALDSSGNGWHLTGTLPPTPTSSITPTNPAASSYSQASSRYYQIPSNAFPAYPLTASTTTYQGTISLWFKTSALNLVNLGLLSMTPLNQLPSTTPSPRWVPLLYIGSNGFLQGSFGFHGNTAALTSTGMVNDARWHQAVLTFTNGVETFYLDGAQVGQRSGLSQSEFSSTGYTYLLGTAYLSAPWQGITTASWRFFEGSLDQVAISPTVLSASDVSTLYNQQKSLFNAPTTITLTSGIPTDQRFGSAGEISYSFRTFFSTTDSEGITFVSSNLSLNGVLYDQRNHYQYTTGTPLTLWLGDTGNYIIGNREGDFLLTITVQDRTGYNTTTNRTFTLSTD